MRPITLALALLPMTATADVPNVVTDIAPVHSLTAQIMGDLGTPVLLLDPGVSPHHFSFRPSQARQLARADLIVRVADVLTPWLADPRVTLAPNAADLALLDTPGWQTLPMRAGGHDHHADPEDHGDDDEHTGHDDAQEHAAEEAGHDGSDSRIDPHAWLDPQAAAAWLHEIAAALSAQDPENAAIYAANRDAALRDLADLEQEIAANLPDTVGGYLLPHDAYQYFETRFDIPATDWVSDGDDAAPGPAHVSELRRAVLAGDVVCVLQEAAGPGDWAQLLTEGTAARIGAIDATGTGLSAGPDLYGDLLRRIAENLRACLAP